MRTQDIIGKKIFDASAKEVGEVEDIEIDWNSKRIKALILGGKGEIAQRLLARARLVAREESDVVIPVEDVVTVGEVILLSIKLG
jgi:sporulation protein YlmC with PRC-barrel domain